MSGCCGAVTAAGPGSSSSSSSGRRRRSQHHHHHRTPGLSSSYSALDSLSLESGCSSEGVADDSGNGSGEAEGWLSNTSSSSNGGGAVALGKPFPQKAVADCVKNLGRTHNTYAGVSCADVVDSV